MDNSELLDFPEDPALSLDNKRRGELAELAFLRKAISLGFGVAKPWGDSDRFDFILSHQRLLWRVQVKSAWGRGPSYKVGISRRDGRRPYTADEIDFLAAYVNTEDLWYIFPVDFLAGRLLFCITPHFRKSPFRKFLEAWQLFREGTDRPVTREGHGFHVGTGIPARSGGAELLSQTADSSSGIGGTGRHPKRTGFSR